MLADNRHTDILITILRHRSRRQSNHINVWIAESDGFPITRVVRSFALTVMANVRVLYEQQSMLSLTKGAKQLRRQFELRLQSLNTLRCSLQLSKWQFSLEFCANFISIYLFTVLPSNAPVRRFNEGIWSTFGVFVRLMTWSAFWHNTSVWQTDRQTDRHCTLYAVLCIASQKPPDACKVINTSLRINNDVLQACFAFDLLTYHTATRLNFNKWLIIMRNRTQTAVAFKTATYHAYFAIDLRIFSRRH